MSDTLQSAPKLQPESAKPLEFSLLGELRVTRGGRPLPLPPSRKTRALLAYVVLTGRAHRRDRLCSMFWDVADDPRGALRWSLSKLRKLVDDDARRLEADRESVRFDASQCEVDVLSLRAALEGSDLESVPIDSLIGWAERFRGELLEGLDLPDFDDYQAWCVAEREQTRRLRARILATITTRLAAQPEQALPHARVRVQVDPLNYDARLDLLKLALASGRREEAEQHYESGRRLLEELGSQQVPELVAAWRELKAAPPGHGAVADAGAPPTSASESSAGSDGQHTQAASVGFAQAWGDRAEGATGSPAIERNAPDASALGLLGRERECGELIACFERVKSERTERMLLVTGEPGIGKSRLLAELRGVAIERGALVLEGSCYEGESGRPYGPWIDALRSADIDGLCQDGAAALLSVLDERSDGEGGRDRLFAGVSDQIAVAAGRAPAIVLILDDVQWIDRASAELLHYVGRTSKHRPLLVLLGARDEELSDNAPLTTVLRSLRRDVSSGELALSPLSVAAIAAILQGMESALPADRVREQSGGNALFALELARTHADEDALPLSLTDAVRDRLERLPQQATDVLRWGAVLGCAFSVARLQALMALEADALIDALETLERHALIRAVGRGDDYLFAHEVVRRVAYADLSEPRRVLMHRQVAKNLQSQVDMDGSLIPDIAHHATLGHDDGLAATACARAGQRCLRLYALGQALTLARRGLRHAERLAEPERVQRIIELKEVERQADRPADITAAVAELEALGEQALNLGCQEHARLAFSLLSYLSWESNNWDGAKERVMQAELATRGTEGKHRVQALAEAGRCLILLERELPEAHAILMEADARGRASDYEPTEVPDGLGMIKAHQGKHEDAEALFRRANRLAAAQTNGVVEYQIIEHLALLQFDRGDHAAAAIEAARLVELGEKLREGSEAPFGRALVAVAAYADSVDAGEALEAALEELRMVDAKHRLAVTLNLAAQIDFDRGDKARAHERAAEALPLATLLERPSEMLLALAMLARTSCDLDDDDGHDAHLATIDAASWDGKASVSARRRAAALLRRETVS